ncbi:hypothetical protein [Mycobacterium sp.]|nr:hypothetical protein [Mycobacterium sp.]HTQ19052.1 hypothetical protein [Mycobacterium sp.]
MSATLTIGTPQRLLALGGLPAGALVDGADKTASKIFRRNIHRDVAGLGG